MRQKLAELVLRLHERTKEGRVQWEEASLGKGYEASFPGYTLGIEEAEIYDSNLRENILEPKLTIYNEEGKPIDQLTADELSSAWNREVSGRPDFYAIMSEIYALARRAALGADKAVDALLEALK